MDPLKVISFAASLVAFLDFGAKLLSPKYRVYKSLSGKDLNIVELSAIADDLNELSAQAEKKLIVLSNNDRVLSESEAKLAALCHDCQGTAKELLGALADLETKGSLNIRFPSLNGFLKALNGTWSLKKTTSLNQREDSKNDDQQTLLVKERLDKILGHTTQIDNRTKVFADELADLPTGKSEDTKLSREGLIDALGDGPQLKGVDDIFDVASGKRPHGHVDHVQRAILHDLEFQGMENREDAIPGAYENTFEWIFPNSSNEADRQHLSEFTNWLEKDINDVFWITGKPGSGKSTLMKYIGNHPSLNKHLQVWAGELPLIEAGFYFWSAGNDLQKSLEGLFRSILYQCLRSHPALISRVAAKRWWILSVLGTDARLPRWTFEEFKSCIYALAAENGKSFRLAFFIDGLDEFEGDHKAITEMIRDISCQYGVNFCIASRPWNVFVDAFRQNPAIQMQDLTKRDIELFIQREFEESPGFQELRPLFPEETDEILQELGNKAEGVFLWVNLVVRSLVEILREEPRVSLLRKTLADLPTNLELIYNAIWKSIDLSKIGSSSRLFQLAMALDVGADGQAGQPSCDAVTIWLAFEADEPNQNIAFLDENSEKHVKSVMTRIISSHTRGILEVSPLGRVNFLHRTARDWVRKPEEWNEILSKSPAGFDSRLAATQALALEATLRKSKIPTNVQDFSTLTSRILCYAGNVTESNTNTLRLVTVLDKFDMDMVGVANKLTYPVWHFQHGKQPKFVATSGNSPHHWSTVLYNRQGGKANCSFLELAATFSVVPYVKAKVSADSSLVKSKGKGEQLPLIETAALGPRHHASTAGVIKVRWYLLTIPYSRRLEMVKFLLDRGAKPEDVKGGSQLAHGDVDGFLCKAGKVNLDCEEIEYWNQLSLLLIQYWGPINSRIKRLGFGIQ